MRAETGPIGGDLSHEFIVLADTGESVVYCDKRVLDLPVPDDGLDYDADLSPIVEAWGGQYYAATEDVHDAVSYEKTPEDQRLQTRGIEVGQVFYFGDKYSAPMKAVVNGPDGKEVNVQMGSYGIGVSRLVGAIIEASHDEAGMIWPDSVAPFDVALVNLRVGDAAVDAACDKAYADLLKAGKDVLYHDTDDRPGAKFAAMDLIGVPWQLIIGPKGLAEGTVELKRRATGERQVVSLEAALSHLTKA